MSKNLELGNLFFIWFWSRWMTQMKAIDLDIVLGAFSYSRINFTPNFFHTEFSTHPGCMRFPKENSVATNSHIAANTQAVL